MSTTPISPHPTSPEPTDFERFEAVMWHLHEQGYYTPPIPWGTSALEGLRLIPPERRSAYLYATESAFAVAFPWHPDETALQESRKPNTPTMVLPLILHLADEGTIVATAFHAAGFFVRWDVAPVGPIWIHRDPFDHDSIPIWAPTPWEHLMDTLRLLQTKGYDAPQEPTIGTDLRPLSPPWVTFGMLEQTIARYGNFSGSESYSSRDVLKVPLFLTWQGNGSEIAATFYAAGCDVWWNRESDTLMGVAPRTSRLRVLSPHFPPWQPQPLNDPDQLPQKFNEEDS